MLSAFLRLFALRPLLAGSLLGIPILTLLFLGVAAALFLKFLLFIVLPVTVVFLIVRAMRKPKHAKIHDFDPDAVHRV